VLLVSVIIPAYNSEETLAQLLHALESQTVPSEKYEVIVVDDGSTDATANLVASFHWAHCVSIPHSGAATARNRGASAARGEILLFTDADCEPQSDWMEKMLAPFADTRVIGAKGVYRTREQGMTARFVQLEYEEKYERMRNADQIDFIDTYSAAYRRQVFLSNGGFDESFPTASVEDQEFSFRLARLGCRMVFIPDAIVFHPHDSSLGAYLRRKFFIGYWKVHLHTRHPTKVWRDSHTPPTLKLQILFLLATLASLAASLYPADLADGIGFALAFQSAPSHSSFSSHGVIV
jgi:cellulose synthase/poly-beta-1,6-N-acetylglucosamine synthase-like glycosyltransferase